MFRIPQYVSIDLVIDVCAEPTAFRGDVKSAIAAALSPAGQPTGRRAFLPPTISPSGSRWSEARWRRPCRRAGVAGVICIHYRVRGRMSDLRRDAEMP